MSDARDPVPLKGDPPRLVVLLSKERLTRIKNSPEPRYTRRLSDQITASFYEACRIGNLIAAEHLMQALECEVTRSIIVAGVDDRYNGDGLSPNTVHFEIRMATLKSIQVAGCGVRGRNG